MTGNVKRNRAHILAAFAAVYLVWGSTYLAIRYAVEAIPPYMLGAFRFITAGAILYAFAVWRGAGRPTRAELRTALITGVLMLAFGNGGVNWAEVTVPSGIVALMVSTVPLWIVLVDWVRPNGKRPRGPVFVGVVLGLIGMVILIGPRVIIGQGNVPTGGVVMLMFGSLSWAIGSLVTRGGPRPRSAMLSMATQMLAGGIAFALIGLLLGEFRDFSFAAVDRRAWLSTVYLTLAGSLIGFTAYIYLLGAVSAAKAATYAYVNPIIAVFLGWLLANEPIGARTIVAAAVILTGVAIITVTQSSGGTPTTGEHQLPVPNGERARSAA